MLGLLRWKTYWYILLDRFVENLDGILIVNTLLLEILEILLSISAINFKRGYGVLILNASFVFLFVLLVLPYLPIPLSCVPLFRLGLQFLFLGFVGEVRRFRR